MKHGFIKIATAAPKGRVADPRYNAEELARIAKQASDAGVAVLVAPELCITGYTVGDLLLSQTLLASANTALESYLNETKALDTVSVLGLPLAVGNKLCNVAAVCKGGEILGFVPKTAVPAYGEFSETRYFAGAWENAPTSVSFAGREIPFGKDLIFACRELPALKIGVGIGTDLDLLFDPTASACAAGATLVAVPAASSEGVCKTARRADTVRSASARAIAAYAYASAGEGESTTDTVFGGHSLIAECGAVLAERKPFAENELTVTEIDVEKILSERRRNNTYPTDFCGKYREIPFSLAVRETVLTRPIDPHPFTPDNAAEQAERADTILAIQTAGLKTRIERAYAKKLVLGISGGLDSTLALLVAVRAMDALNRPRTDVIAVTMPGFGTTKRTKSNATVLCRELGVDFRTVSIAKAVELHFKDIGHDPSVRDVTYENCQARERTQVLMDIANDCGGMVLGTGDLSELALGWATYNGDHMSMYGVNASIPKTLIRQIVGHCAAAEEAKGQKKIAVALRDVLDTPVSPELLPAENGEIAQKTEDLVGPYELHDFYLYYMLRFGYSPTKLLRLAEYALGDVYDRETMLKWLKTFVRRFFAQQFKRSCSPDGPKVGSVTLSPRGDWKMPSDASSAAWLKELETL